MTLLRRRAESDFGQEAGTTLEAGDEASAGAFSCIDKGRLLLAPVMPLGS